MGGVFLLGGGGLTRKGGGSLPKRVVGDCFLCKMGGQLLFTNYINFSMRNCMYFTV